MSQFRYRALTRNGDEVTGAISAASAADVIRRIETLGLIPIKASVAEDEKQSRPALFSSRSEPRPEDVTLFTGDLALLLRTGARIDEALELFSDDADIGRLRPTIKALHVRVLSGDGFGDAVARCPAQFSPMYVALVRVGEASGALPDILEALAAERVRAAVLRRRFQDALRYPAFVLVAALGVLVFFLSFVLPQFSTVLRDFNAKLDPAMIFFLALSDFLRAHAAEIAGSLVAAAAAFWYAFRQPRVRSAIAEALLRLPALDRMLQFHQTAVFCRNLGVLLGNGVALPTTLRILADMMSSTGSATRWTRTGDLVRRGGRLSDALAQTKAVPVMAVRTLRLGEESGQLPLLSERIAEFYEAKLQRSLDRIAGFIGPAAIILISILVGGLIVSVMTALLSVNQIVG